MPPRAGRGQAAPEPRRTGHRAPRRPRRPRPGRTPAPAKPHTPHRRGKPRGPRSALHSSGCGHGAPGSTPRPAGPPRRSRGSGRCGWVPGGSTPQAGMHPRGQGRGCRGAQAAGTDTPAPPGDGTLPRGVPLLRLPSGPGALAAPRRHRRDHRAGRFGLAHVRRPAEEGVPPRTTGRAPRRAPGGTGGRGGGSGAPRPAAGAAGRPRGLRRRAQPSVIYSGASSFPALFRKCGIATGCTSRSTLKIKTKHLKTKRFALQINRELEPSRGEVGLRWSWFGFISVMVLRVGVLIVFCFSLKALYKPNITPHRIVLGVRGRDNNYPLQCSYTHMARSNKSLV